MLDKKCPRCKQIKPVSSFSKDKRADDGLRGCCRACASKTYKRDWYKVNKLICTKKSLRKLYGVSLEQYDEMLEEQDGVCKICGGINPNGVRLAVDHNHDTGEIRGLLCSRCNLRIGWIENNLSVIGKMLNYLSETT